MRTIFCLIAAALLIAPAATMQAAGGDKNASHGRCRLCPGCGHDCTLEVSKDQEARNCYDVECKPICIPRVVFPWQKKACCDTKGCDGKSCCTLNNGARTKYVRVLKKYEYHCSVCKYKWNPAPMIGVCDKAVDKPRSRPEKRHVSVSDQPSCDTR